MDCGADVDRNIKPGKAKRCLPCALEAMARQHKGYADGTHPNLATSRAAGLAVGEQIRNRNGPMWDRWVGGMIAYMDTGNTTEDA